MKRILLFCVIAFVFTQGVIAERRFCKSAGTDNLPSSAASDTIDLVCWNQRSCWEKYGIFHQECNTEMVQGLQGIINNPTTAVAEIMFARLLAAVFSLNQPQFITLIETAVSAIVRGIMPEEQTGTITVTVANVGDVEFDYYARKSMYRHHMSWTVRISDKATGSVVAEVKHIQDHAEAFSKAGQLLVANLRREFGVRFGTCGILADIDTGLSCVAPETNGECSVQKDLTSVMQQYTAANALRIKFQANLGETKFGFATNAPTFQQWFSEPLGPKNFLNTLNYDSSTHVLTLNADADGWGDSGARGKIDYVRIMPLQCGVVTHGWVDSITQTSISGWACHRGDSTPVIVHIYSGTTFIGSVTAASQREEAVGQQCGGSTTHGFQWNFPNQLASGTPIDVYVYNWALGPNPKLPGSNIVM